MSRRLRPLADREAILALGLAGAGFLSLEATLPAAGALAVRSIRTPRASDGTGPAVGVLVFAVAWISFLLGYPTLRAMWLTATEHGDPLRVVAFVGGWVALAVAALLLANFLVRCHPERWVARGVARAGIVAVIAAGLMQFLAITGVRMQEPGTRRCGDSIAECLGSPPWASLAPGLAVGTAWFLGSLAIAGLARARRRP
ncbi:MAG: hypothetical protein ACRDHI_09840 [Actinomycetota bacterium]